MSYAIGNIIYGYDTPATLIQYLEDQPDKEPPGIIWLYSAGGVQQGYLGIRLGQIDETDTVDLLELLRRLFPDTATLAGIRTHLDQTHRRQVDQLRQQLKPKIRKSFTGEPKLLIIWSSS